MSTPKPDRTRLAVCLCAVMLLGCLAVLGCYLAPVLFMQEPEGDAFGMVLIDIADEETAVSYHVQACGVYVLAVPQGSPAGAAGVASGDLLLCINDTPVQSTSHFMAMQEGFEPGQIIRMQFGRGNSSYEIHLVWNEEQKVRGEQ